MELYFQKRDGHLTTFDYSYLSHHIKMIYGTKPDIRHYSKDTLELLDAEKFNGVGQWLIRDGFRPVEKPSSKRRSDGWILGKIRK